MSYPSSSTPTPNTRNGLDKESVANAPLYTLANGLGSGASPATFVQAEADTGVIHLEAASSNAFDVEVQARPDSSYAWATLKNYTDSDTNDSDALEDGVNGVESGEYRVLHNSGEAVTVTLSV